jgi:hypothetical protein
MAPLGFQLHKFQMLIPDNGNGLPNMWVGKLYVCILYAVYVQAVGILIIWGIKVVFFPKIS